MKSFLPANTSMTRRRSDVDGAASPATESVATDPALTQVLPETAPEASAGWYRDGAPSDGVGNGLELTEPEDGNPDEGGGVPVLPPADHEPFVPKPRFVMGRSTRILACVALVAAGAFAGSAVQKQIDTGNRAARFGNFQGPGAGTGSGTGSGNATTGQGRRNGGTGAGGSPAGGAGSGPQTAAPTPGPGQ